LVHHFYDSKVQGTLVKLEETWQIKEWKHWKQEDGGKFNKQNNYEFERGRTLVDQLDCMFGLMWISEWERRKERYSWKWIGI
jgi:hypothetical protein